MKYYRVKKEYDGFGRSDGLFLIQNELYTEKEMERYKIPRERTTECGIKKTDVYWMFGARFSVDCGYSD